MKNYEVNFISSVFRRNKVYTQRYGGTAFRFGCGHKRYLAQFYSPPRLGCPEVRNCWLVRIDGIYNDAEMLRYFDGLEKAILWLWLAIKKKRKLSRLRDRTLLFFYSDF